jgi:arylamine N-acetyltransferase
MPQQSNLLLSLKPEDHQDAVALFLNHFKLAGSKPDLRQLRIILRHYSKIPYENISKIIRQDQFWQEDAWRVRLPEEVMQDYITKHLGGTCFSLTFFLQSILICSGYTCYPVMADMRAGKNIHCCVIALLKGKKYLIDPGYLLNQPMEISPKDSRLYKTEFTGVELRHSGEKDSYNLFTFSQQSNKWRYRFTDRPVAQDEFLQHWLASFNWNSMHALCLTKSTDNSLLYIRKNFMRETTLSGKKNYNIKRNLHEAIHRHFGIDREIVEQALAALQQNMQRKKSAGPRTAGKR